MGAINSGVSPFSLSSLSTLLEHADRIRTQEKTDKNKPYALHTPEIERISQRRRCPLGSTSIPKRLT